MKGFFFLEPFATAEQVEAIGECPRYMFDYGDMLGEGSFGGANLCRACWTICDLHVLGKGHCCSLSAAGRADGEVVSRLEQEMIDPRLAS